MSQKRGGDTIELKIQLNAAEEKRFLSYVERNKFKSHRQAFVHLIGLAEIKDDAPMEEDKDEVADTVKEEDTKKGKGRKGKKGAGEPTPVVDEENKADTNGEIGAENTKDVVKHEEPKKGKGRKGKKAEETAVQMEEHETNGPEAAKDTAKDEDDKKGKGRQDKKVNEPTLEIEKEESNDNVLVPPDPAKEDDNKKGKGRKGKKGAEEVAVAMEEETKNADTELAGENGAAEGDQKPTKKGTGKKAAPRKGKQATPEPNGKSDATFVAGDAPVQDSTVKPEPAKKGRRGKKAATEPIAEEAGEGNEDETAASKPKRGRAAKLNKKYVEADASD